MDYQALRTLIDDDPDTRGYATMSDAAVAADLNQRRHMRRRPVPIGEFSEALYSLGVFTTIAQAAEAGKLSAAGALKTIRLANELGAPRIDLDRPQTKAMLDGLVSEAVITAAQRAEIVALGNAPASLADIAGLGPTVYPEDVAHARRLA